MACKMTTGFYFESPPGFGESAFRLTALRARDSGLIETMDEMGEEGGYHGGIDWLLCRLLPEFEGECRAYYRGEGKKFIANHRGAVRRVDLLLVRAVQCLLDFPGMVGVFDQEEDGVTCGTSLSA